MIMNLNRTLAPQIQQANDIRLHKPDNYQLSNGIDVFEFNIGSQELIKVEFIFRAGSWYQNKAFVAAFTNSLIKSGTKKFTSKEIVEKLDFYGAYLETYAGKDNSIISLYTLNKHLNNTLSILEDLVKNATFPQEELDILLAKQKQKLNINKQKVSFVAGEHLNEVLFGEDHPYGRRQKEEYFDRIQREDVCGFYKSYFTPDNCTLIVAGNVPSDMSRLLELHFTDWEKGTRAIVNHADPVSAIEKQHFFEKQGALQSAIRVGKVMFGREHPEFKELMVLNTILGGYFGSRLMTNIREDKGYTYGIGSALATQKHAGYFFVSTEVGADFTKDSLNEIYKEMDILRNELVSEHEMQLVKNYMIGSFMRSIDGPFALSDKYRVLLNYELDFDYYHSFIDVVRNMRAERVRELAQQYLEPESFYQVVAGKMI